jgi:hypothetical protein
MLQRIKAGEKIPDMAFLHIELEMDHIPAPGDRITLDGGSGYIVQYLLWYVDTEVRSTPEWTLNGNVEGPGNAYLTVEVLPEDWHWDNNYGEGRKSALFDVREQIEETIRLGFSPSAILAALARWMTQQGVDTANNATALRLLEQQERATDRRSELQRDFDSGVPERMVKVRGHVERIMAQLRKDDSETQAEE